jgi:hypothetical protein
MTKHTELPWAVASNDRAIIREVPDIADGCDHYMVAVLSSHSLIGHEEAKANAAYIVRACSAFPDLVKALELIEYASRKDSLTDHERLQSVRTVVCGILSRMKGPSK